MTEKELTENPAFRSMVRASGQGEIWTNTTDKHKFNQYGWRCGTNENEYELDTLMGNWFEERSEIERQKIPECLPSQYGHYFNSLYNSTYNTTPVKMVPEVLKNLKGRYSHAYPHHQPELDTENLKAIYSSWKTTYRADYLDPRWRTKPVVVALEKGVEASDGGPRPVPLPPTRVTASLKS
ncbi:hypothetical protein ACOMHN_042099 [Nucella lapillus]